MLFRYTADVLQHFGHIAGYHGFGQRLPLLAILNDKTVLDNTGEITIGTR